MVRMVLATAMMARLFPRIAANRPELRLQVSRFGFRSGPCCFAQSFACPAVPFARRAALTLASSFIIPRADTSPTY